MVAPILMVGGVRISLVVEGEDPNFGGIGLQSRAFSDCTCV